MAAGLYLFLPLVGRRNAGVKFYRLILITDFVLIVCAGVAHAMAGSRSMALADAGVAMLVGVVYGVLRYPRRLVFRLAASALALGLLIGTCAAYDVTIRPSNLAWSLAGVTTSVALLGSVNLAMLLGHWYLVVRGMSIDPLKRLTFALLGSMILKVVAVGLALAVAGSDGLTPGSPLYRIAVSDGIFFWMRVGWGLVGPIVLYPMIWGTVKIRSTMAATGILYVAVVAVIIGEILGTWLSKVHSIPV